MNALTSQSRAGAHRARWCAVVLFAVAMYLGESVGVRGQVENARDVPGCLSAQSGSVMWSCRIPTSGNAVHGLSGLFYDAAAATLWAVSDDIESYPDEPARLLTFDLTAHIALTGSVPLRRENAVQPGEKRPAWQLEAIAPVLENGRWTGSFFVATEYDHLSPQFSSGIYRCSSAGDCQQAFTLPGEFAQRPGNTAWGIQDNKGLEGLTVTPDGTKLFAALESALAQDVRANQRDRVRLLEYAPDGTNAPVRQYVYRLDAAPPKVDRARGATGISEILAVSATELLVLERSFTRGCGNTIRLFKTTLDPSRSFTTADDVSGLAEDRLLTKELLIDFGTEARAFADPKLAGSLENFEGLAFGPDLPDHTPTLLMVSDDNRGGDQINSLVRIRMSSLPTSGARSWKDGDPPVFASDCN